MTQHPPPGPPHSQPPFGSTPPYPGAPGQPLSPRRKPKALLWVLLGVGVFLLLCCGGGTIIGLNSADKSTDRTIGGGDDRSTGPTGSPTGPTGSASAAPKAPPPPAKPAPAEATIGAPVRDGKFEFVVKKVECGKTKVGGEYLSKTAQGQFCLVTMSVKNIGDKPQHFSDSNQKAFSDKGTEFAPDSAASMYANQDQQVWLNEINPGNTLNGTIVFDIPKDAKIVRLELHDSAFSGGVKVRVA